MFTLNFLLISLNWAYLRVPNNGREFCAIKLLAVYDRDRHGHPPLSHYVYKLFFQCELVGGSPSSSIETDVVAFFCENAIPEPCSPSTLLQQNSLSRKKWVQQRQA